MSKKALLKSAVLQWFSPSEKAKRCAVLQGVWGWPTIIERDYRSIKIIDPTHFN